MGVLLFLIAAGLTLVFGVMDFINLAHGVQYMLGAYLAVAFYGDHRQLSGCAHPGLACGSLAFGLLLEFLIFRHLYDRDHLDQVIATFGIILFLNHGSPGDLGRGATDAAGAGILFTGSVVLKAGLLYPVWRLVIIACGLGYRGRALRTGVIHPDRHAGAGGSNQCPHGLGAWGQHRTAVHDRVRLRHHVGGIWPAS